jgi:hypothetical protein
MTKFKPAPNNNTPVINRILIRLRRYSTIPFNDRTPTDGRSLNMDAQTEITAGGAIFKKALVSLPWG